MKKLILLLSLVLVGFFAARNKKEDVIIDKALKLPIQSIEQQPSSKSLTEKSAAIQDHLSTQ